MPVNNYKLPLAFGHHTDGILLAMLLNRGKHPRLPPLVRHAQTAVAPVQCRQIKFHYSHGDSLPSVSPPVYIFIFCGTNQRFSRREPDSIFIFCGTTPALAPKSTRTPPVVAPPVTWMSAAVVAPIVGVGFCPSAQPAVYFFLPHSAATSLPGAVEQQFQLVPALYPPAHYLPVRQGNIRLKPSWTK